MEMKPTLASAEHSQSAKQSERQFEPATRDPHCSPQTHAVTAPSADTVVPPKLPVSKPTLNSSRQNGPERATGTLIDINLTSCQNNSFKSCMFGSKLSKSDRSQDGCLKHVDGGGAAGGGEAETVGRTSATVHHPLPDVRLRACCLTAASAIPAHSFTAQDRHIFPQEQWKKPSRRPLLMVS